VLDVIPLGGDLSGNVELNNPGSRWAAQLTAVPLGTLGNQISFSIGFIESTTASIEVVDHRYFDAATDTWSELRDCVGIRVAGNDSTATVTIASVEAAIAAGSTLCLVTTPHVTPTATIDFTAMAGDTISAMNDAGVGGFHDGAFSASTGESVKLTGLGLEIGVKRGLWKRLAAAQRT
jgi:hypothetical protein